MLELQAARRLASPGCCPPRRRTWPSLLSTLMLFPSPVNSSPLSVASALPRLLLLPVTAAEQRRRRPSKAAAGSPRYWQQP